MPTYSYKCKECGKVFDAFHSMSCTDAHHCPACDGVGQRLMSASSVIFKGSGFYSTDYRDSGYLEAKKKDADKPGESKTETKATGDSKATPAAEAKPEKTEKPAAAKAEPVAAAA